MLVFGDCTVFFWRSLFMYVIGHYNPSVRIIDIVSHSTYVVCINLKDKWRALQFKVDSERQIFSGSFHGNFIYLLSVFLPEFCWEQNRQRNTFCIFFWCPSNKLTHYLLDYGDFTVRCTLTVYGVFNKQLKNKVIRKQIFLNKTTYKIKCFPWTFALFHKTKKKNSYLNKSLQLLLLSY